MNRVGKITACFMGGLLLFAIWSTSGLSQGQSNPPPRDELSAGSQPQTTRLKQLGSEEKLVRDVYARLMRYQSAAQDELAAKANRTTTSDEYLTFELRNIRSGPVAMISSLPLSEFVTPKAGPFIAVTPKHLTNGNETPHAYYEVQWAQASTTEKADDPTVGEMLLRQRAQHANRYTSFEVNISFQEQTRRYRALALYQFAGPSEASVQPQVQKAEPPTRVLIWDNITSEMNTVLKEESPRIQSPWDKYIKTSWYRGVVNEIAAARQAGKPLIPADAPIGYLPGDSISATTDDQRAIANTDPCAPACAIPTNFRQTAASDAGGGTLHFEYRWDSSSGNLADLANCEVGEKVDYPAGSLPFPSPPFPANLNPPNPTIINVAGNNGGFQDNHSTPGAFVKPYSAASVTASQIYRFHCPCHQSDAWVTLMGPLNIVRSVSQNQNGSWNFTITKSGSSATINPLP